jgi:plasmid stabilization system protein ParE
MNYNIQLSTEAQTDLEKIIEWYGNVNKDVSLQLINKLEQTISTIALNLYLFKEVYKTFRQASINKFPDSLHNRIEQNNIIIIAITHQKRKPSIWEKENSPI